MFRTYFTVRDSDDIRLLSHATDEMAVFRNGLINITMSMVVMAWGSRFERLRSSNILMFSILPDRSEQTHEEFSFELDPADKTGIT